MSFKGQDTETSRLVEFAHRPSTRIDPEILLRTNRAAFVPDNEASIGPGRKRNGRARRVIDSSVPLHIRVNWGVGFM